MINRDDNLAKDLLQVLADLDASHVELCVAVDGKIRHMRSCDSAGILRSVEAQQRIVERIGPQEKQRRQVVGRLLRGFGIGPERVAKITATELAEKLPPAIRPAFLEKADQLRKTLSRIASRNRVASRLSGTMVAHFDSLLEAMAMPQEQRGSYSRQGRKVRLAPVTLFEAVG